MRNAHRFLKTQLWGESKKRDKEFLAGEDATCIWYHFQMYCLSLLVNAKTMEEFDTILTDIAMCLNCKYQNPEMMKCFDKIWQRIDKLL